MSDIGPSFEDPLDKDAEIKSLRAELANLREAAFEVERFALPYWEDGGDPRAIPVSNEAMRGLQAALYPEGADDAERG